ncbi:hypothetical protein ACFY19_13530 [Streptosporangium saharense]|uniref:Uncharacterized protein n=1 Tax=Streptosporangium saharense TaxID=1706840 RepID=A0A7W7QWA1_9ACTN|nr:hypothetical protein [Streptosporangium saharense]MBB4920693.1 hypothetical protein [Streptosporangium saharense]
MAIRFDDLYGHAALPDDALDSVVGGRPTSAPPSPKVCTSVNGEPDTCSDYPY